MQNGSTDEGARGQKVTFSNVPFTVVFMHERISLEGWISKAVHSITNNLLGAGLDNALSKEPRWCNPPHPVNFTTTHVTSSERPLSA